MSFKLSPEEIEKRRQLPADVPCNTCSACCKNDRIILNPARGDRLDQYQWHFEDGIPVLNRKENGECIYLDANGCSIPRKAPNICRRFDCRILFLITPKEIRKKRIKEKKSMKDVYEAGRSRLHTLSNEPSKK